MSGATVVDFLAYWESEGEGYVRRGDYDWMASLVPGRRVLEVGCGVGFGTVALARRGLEVLAVDSLSECLERARGKLFPQAAVRSRHSDRLSTASTSRPRRARATVPKPTPQPTSSTRRPGTREAIQS
jgi:SAM-dependent methyltransferase